MQLQSPLSSMWMWLTKELRKTFTLTFLWKSMMPDIVPQVSRRMAVLVGGSISCGRWVATRAGTYHPLVSVQGTLLVLALSAHSPVTTRSLHRCTCLTTKGANKYQKVSKRNHRVHCTPPIHLLSAHLLSTRVSQLGVRRRCRQWANVICEADRGS